MKAAWAGPEAGGGERCCPWQECLDSCGSWELAEQGELRVCRARGSSSGALAALRQPLLPAELCFTAQSFLCNPLSSPCIFHLLFHQHCMQNAWMGGRQQWEAVEQQEERSGGFEQVIPALGHKGGVGYRQVSRQFVFGFLLAGWEEREG